MTTALREDFEQRVLPRSVSKNDFQDTLSTVKKLIWLIVDKTDRLSCPDARFECRDCRENSVENHFENASAIRSHRVAIEADF